jgi:FPC/CPF motif-containing protein YcgG
VPFQDIDKMRWPSSFVAVFDTPLQMFRQQVHESFFPLFKRHALKKDGRALDRIILTGTIDSQRQGLGGFPRLFTTNEKSAGSNSSLMRHKWRWSS